MADTASEVDIVIQTNTTWEDAFMFGTTGDTSWSFTGQSFRLDIKGNANDTAALLSLTSASGKIVVADVVQRILRMNVDEAVITAALKVGTYVYDLIMFDASVPAVRVALMRGEIELSQGVTGG